MLYKAALLADEHLSNMNLSKIKFNKNNIITLAVFADTPRGHDPPYPAAQA